VNQVAEEVAVPEDPVSDVLNASLTAADARRKVQMLSTVALIGGQYDPEVLDAAIVSYRHAQQAASAAFASWATWRQDQALRVRTRRRRRAA
jgi:hypothetical protein